MRRSILALMILPMFAAVASGGQLCSQEPFSESFGYSSEDFGGGSYLGVDTRDVTADRLADLKLKEEHGVEVTLFDQDAPGQGWNQRARRNSHPQRQPGGKRGAVATHDPRDSSGTHREPRNQ